MFRFSIINIAFCLLLTAPCNSQNVNGLNLQLLGAKIKVTDMKEALDFYVGVMGYKVKAGNIDSDLVILEDPVMTLALSKTNKVRKVNYPNETQTILVFETKNLDSAVMALRKRGVEFYCDEPQKVGVGLSTKFYDPFGNIHSLLQETVGEKRNFKEPRIYNVGYYIDDIEKGRQFYSVNLELPIRTLRYYPPALPLNDNKGEFCTILHYRQTASKVEINYDKETYVALMLKTSNITNVLELLKKKNISIVKQLRQSALGEYIVLVDAFGNYLEIYQE